MVIVAFVLVLLAAATFAAGIAASRTSDALVYVSIVFSLAAFVTLAIASLRARQAEREAAGTEDTTARLRTLVETEAHVGPLLGGLDPAQLDMTPSWRRQQRVRREVPDPVLDEQLENEEDEADFEVPVEPVGARVQSGDELAWGFEDEADEEDDEDAGQQEATAAFTPALDDEDLDAFETFDEDELVDLAEPELEPEPADSSQESFFDQYDDLTAAEIIPFLQVLDPDGLQWVRARERSGAKRVTVLNKADQLIAGERGRPARASTPKKPPAKKAASARRTTKSPAKSTTKSTRRR